MDSPYRGPELSTTLQLVLSVISGLTAGSLVHYTHEASQPKLEAPMPDPQLTPGATLQVTADEICVSGYSAKVRHVTSTEKEAVFRRYKIRKHGPGQYEIDHLISLELGGSNDITNLWPQPYFGPWNAHLKDELENKLHKLVCEGHVKLEDAQREIRTNWVEAYEKYVSN